VLHNIMWHTNSLHLCAQDRLTLLASGATGQAVTDIYGATLNGATLHPFDIREDGLTWLASRLIENEITIYHSSTSVFRAFVDSLSGAEDFSRIRLIKLGGEPVSRKELDSYKKHFSTDCILVNTLSATETGAIRQHMMDASATISGEIAPVGFPVDDKKLLLLDDAGEEVELGSAGEICIESPYLARGYWRKPELTDAAFSASPSAEGLRIYRSGDLGRMDGSGHLIYLGRKDSRLKIRGYTVEIAEIEAALRGVKGISEAAVVAHDYGIERRIAAYVIPECGIELSAGTLRKELAAALPGFMIPSAFVYLKSMPRTPNGKVDRRALPPPETSRPRLDADFVAPRTALEEKVAAIWVDVLGISPIGVRDNFFDLGGNSLMAAQVLSRLYRVFGSDVSMRNFFESPTVAAVVLTVVQNKAERISGANITRILDELAPSSSDAAIIGRDETKRTYTGRAE
jgi:acyl-coenzyme A synthetase/AMP-(fatty) acid ligase/acyl carrier protein